MNRGEGYAKEGEKLLKRVVLRSYTIPGELT